MTEIPLWLVAMRQWEETWSGPDVEPEDGEHDPCGLLKRNKAWDDVVKTITKHVSDPLLARIQELEVEVAELQPSEDDNPEVVAILSEFSCPECGVDNRTEGVLSTIAERVHAKVGQQDSVSMRLPQKEVRL